MTSYLANWFSAKSETTTSVAGDPDGLTISPPSDGEDNEGSDTETERGDDVPPAFPSLQSAQRVQQQQQRQPSALPSQSNGLPRVLTDSQLMPPPPLPNANLATRTPARNLAAIPSSARPGSLNVPPTTIKRPNSSKTRLKVALEPGHGPLDWANLKASGRNLRGVDTLMRIPPSVLKQHNKPDDAWSAFHGKVYNITPYLSYHPGGEKELMRVAGRDGTKLFALTHAWVNIDFMLDACLVGFLVPEPLS